MFDPKTMLVSLALVLGLIGVSGARADDAQPCYTLDSLDGDYAVVGTYGANVALAIGVRHLDGKGNLTGTFTLNEPTPGSTTGARTILTGTQLGTYNVNCDGTGTISRTVTASNGVTATQMDDFVITKAVWKHDHLVATALQDAQRTPSAIVAGGIFLIRTWTRLSSHASQ
jgi:hypothetical protein